MNKAELAGYEFLALDELEAMDSPLHRMSPFSKLIMTIAYIIITVSFYKYDISGLIFMVLFPVIGYQFAYVPIRTCFYRLRIVMPLVCIVGLFNPFFDKEIMMYIRNIPVTGGVISMLVLMLKGIFCLMASFLLIATTRIEDICASLNYLHFPRLLTSLIILTYRYISVLLEETDILITSYKLRAPGQRGIHYKVWGTFLGQLILRSISRAGELFDSMVLRGFNGEIPVAGINGSKMSYVVAGVCIILMIVSRLYNIPFLIGNALIR